MPLTAFWGWVPSLWGLQGRTMGGSHDWEALKLLSIASAATPAAFLIYPMVEYIVELYTASD